MAAYVINDLIRTIMKESGVTQQSMAFAIGKTKATDVSARLNSKNMTFDKAIEMLNVCGYEVVVQKRKQGKRPDGQYLVARSCDVAEEEANDSDDGKKGGAEK